MESTNTLVPHADRRIAADLHRARLDLERNSMICEDRETNVSHSLSDGPPYETAKHATKRTTQHVLPWCPGILIDEVPPEYMIVDDWCMMLYDVYMMFR